MSTADEFRQGVSYSLLCVGLPDIALKHVTAICLLYEQINVSLWLPTRFRKSICYEMLPFIFDFRSDGEFHSVVLVVSIRVSLMVKQVALS